MSRKVNQMVEQQLRAWQHQNREKLRHPSREEKYFPVITVSREFGTLGAALSELLGKQLPFKVWDKKLLQEIAKELGSDEKFLESLDERRRDPVGDAVLGFLNIQHTNVNYLISLVKVVKTIEEYGSSIIVGRGARYICENENSLHIRVVSPLKTRIREFAKRENISRDESYEIIKDKDAERADFIQYSFNKDIANAADYDLLLNSGTYTLEEMAKMVIQAYEIKTGRTLPKSEIKPAE
ncbi:MAG: cytidylate kinase-like family protein [Balneolaceae bacterium]|nr:cytidylate kinase-like family protein [Balneolaceae bacterium]